MKLFKVYRTDKVNWDEYRTFAIIAHDSAEALSLVTACILVGWGSILYGQWTAEEIDLDNETESRILVEDYNAG